MERFFRGGCAGLLATAPMTLVMHLGHRWPVREKEALPPQQITEHLAARAGAKPHLDRAQLRALSGVNHCAFGAAMGALYALWAPRVPAPALLKGALWGLLVWAASYAGWIPAARILPPPTHHSTRRNLLMIGAHLVWGVSMAHWAQPDEAAPA